MRSICWVCSAEDDDDGWPVVCVIIGKEKVVPTEAWADIINPHTRTRACAHTTRYLGAVYGGVADLSKPVKWESGEYKAGRAWGSFCVSRHWLKTAHETHLWVPEAKEIGCNLKITPVGGRGGGTAKLHVNQALYKFSLCLLEELKHLRPPTRAPGKKRKFCPGYLTSTEMLQTGWFRSGGWL